MADIAPARTRVAQTIIDTARAVLRRAGVDLVRYPQIPPQHISNYLRLLRIDTVLDVGANSGQYAMHLRRGGYQGRIISFEPGCKAFDALQKNARGDSLWICHKLALGDQDGELVLQIAEASEFSSFLPLTEWVLESDPNAQTRTEERVPVATLDTFWPTYNLGQSRVLLKLDTQGFERQILLGAARSLEHITGIQLELSLRTAYVGQPMIEEMLPLLRTLGFELFAVYEGFRQSNSTRLIELDGLFFRSC